MCLFYSCQVVSFWFLSSCQCQLREFLSIFWPFSQTSGACSISIPITIKNSKASSWCASEHIHGVIISTFMTNNCLAGSWAWKDIFFQAPEEYQWPSLDLQNFKKILKGNKDAIVLLLCLILEIFSQELRKMLALPKNHLHVDVSNFDEV